MHPAANKQPIGSIRFLTGHWWSQIDGFATRPGQEVAAWAGAAGNDPSGFVGGNVLSQGSSLHRNTPQPAVGVGFMGLGGASAS